MIRKNEIKIIYIRIHIPITINIMNPLNTIWGCHFHIDTDDNNLISQELIQKMYEYLYDLDADIYSVGVFTPGFGPHTQYDH